MQPRPGSTSRSARRLCARLLSSVADGTANEQAIGDNLSHLKGKFPGPTGSVYEGGTFEGASSSSFSASQLLKIDMRTVDIVVPDNYPFSPLKVRLPSSFGEMVELTRLCFSR